MATSKRRNFLRYRLSLLLFFSLLVSLLLAGYRYFSEPQLYVNHELDLGVLEVDEVAKTEISFFNAGFSTAKIQLKGAHMRMYVRESELEVEPWSHKNLHVELVPRKSNSLHRWSIIVTTNDPAQPEIRFNVLFHTRASGQNDG